MKAYALVVLVGVAGCWEGVTGVKGSGNAKTEVRPIAGFGAGPGAVDVSGSLRVEIAIAAEPRVEVSGDDNLIALVDTQVRGDVLVVTNHGSMRPVVPLVVRIAAPRLQAIDASGATTVTLHGMRDNQMSINLQGAATLHGDGAVHELTIDASGAGTLDLDRLTAERARVTASGSATVMVNVTQALDVRVSGAGTVSYSGNPPDVKPDVSGAGSLVKR
jgi:hypothetical protein